MHICVSMAVYVVCIYVIYVRCIYMFAFYANIIAQVRCTS